VKPALGIRGSNPEELAKEGVCARDEKGVWGVRREKRGGELEKRKR